MEFFIAGLLIGVAASTVVWVAAMRRANSKPDGNTSKIVKALGGGGGGPNPKLP